MNFIRCFLFIVLTFALSTTLVLATHTDSHKEMIQAAKFNAKVAPIAIVPDSRLNFGTDGTIEIGFALSTASEYFVPDVMTLMANAGETGKRFVVQITNAGRAISLTGNNGTFSLPFDFRGGDFYQLALSTSGAKTDVIVEGRNIGSLPTGYGSAVNIPLYIGRELAYGSNWLHGFIYYARLWSKPLNVTDLEKTRAFYFDPTDNELRKHLVLYSKFTNLQNTLRYANERTVEETLRTSGAGNSRGGYSAFFDAIPPGFEISDVSIHYDQWITGIQFFYRDSSGVKAPAPFRGSATGLVKSFSLNPGESIIRIEGRFGALVDSVNFHTDQGRQSGAMGGTGGSNNFDISIPTGAKLSGFVGRTGASLDYLALGYKYEPIIADADQRWIMRDQKPPRRNDALFANKSDSNDGYVALHGNYTDVPAFRLKSNKFHNVVTVHSIYDVFNKPYDILTRVDNESFKSANWPHLTVNFDGRGGFSYGREKFFSKVKPYEPAGQDSEEFGGTFNRDAQIPFREFPFLAFDITKLNPYNFQLTTGHGSRLFKFPSDTSKDYYLSKGAPQKIVPHGLFMVSDIEGREGSTTKAIRSSAEHTNTWSRSAGAKIGIPKVASFGFNKTWSGVKSSARSQEKMLTLTRDTFQNYTLVIDHSKVELDPDFRTRVEEIAQLIRKSKKPYHDRYKEIDYYNEIIKPYGTHYAYATTMGGMAMLEMQFSKDSYKEMYEKGSSLSINAKAAYKKKAKGGGSFESKNSSSSTTEREISNQISNFHSIGGAASSGAVFSLADHEVPIFLDLRPIETLLSPIFFDDPVIYQQVRFGLQERIKTYARDAALHIDGAENLWEPYLYQASVDRILVRNASEIDDDVELYGKLHIRYGVGDAQKSKETAWHRSWEDATEYDIDEGDSEYPARKSLFVVTAKELCDGAWIEIGGFLKDEEKSESKDTKLGRLHYDAELLEVSGKVTGILRYHEHKPNILAPATPFQLPFVSGDGDAVDVYVSIKRLAGIEGNMQMPACK